MCVQSSEHKNKSCSTSTNICSFQKFPFVKSWLTNAFIVFFLNHIIFSRSDEETSSVFSNRLQHLLQLIPHVTLYPLCWLNTLTADWCKPLNRAKSKTSCCFCWCFVRRQVNILRYILYSEIVTAQGIQHLKQTDERTQSNFLEPYDFL